MKGIIFLLLALGCVFGDHGSFEIQPRMESMESMEGKEPMESMEGKESMESIESKEPMESMETKESMESMASKESMESMESMVSKESMESMESMESKESMEGKESMDSMESTESMESMETMESMNMGKWEIQPRSTSEEYFSLESNEREPIDVASLSGGKKSLDRNARFSPLECGVNKTLNYGEYVVIESPGFGQTLYPNNFQCLWNLIIPANSKLMFSCESFRTLRGDILFLGRRPLFGISFAGFSLRPFQSPNNDAILTMKFKTNRAWRTSGFRCFLDSEEKDFTTTTMTTTAAPGVTTSSNMEKCNCGIPNRSNRIVGGVETETNEYPWQVALVSSGGSRPFCGGTLISCSHVLTAAHCTAGSSASSISVLVGEHRIDDNSFTRVSLSKITDHPDYNSNTLDNDYSILTLSSPVEFSTTVAPACLPADNSKDFAGEMATVSGWGRLSSGGNQPTVLNEVDVTVQSNSQCMTAYGNSITSNMICAADAGKDSCQGDSGGPLTTMENGKCAVIGVVSWGYGCAVDGFPGVYARVTEKMDWILANTSGTQLSSCTAADGKFGYGYGYGK